MKLDTLFYLIFPRRCKICGEVVELDKELCPVCAGTKKISGKLCFSCGCSYYECQCAPNEQHYFDRVIAPFYYQDNIPKAVHRLKFYNYTDIGANMADYMYSMEEKYYSDIVFDYVTFVPMTRLHKYKRKYNQSEIIAKQLSKLINVPLLPLLVKTKNTKSQRGSSKYDRQVNLLNAFSVNKKYNVKGKTILLVDDVKTTGSTLNECAKTLKNAGADSVYAVVFASVKKY